MPVSSATSRRALVRGAAWAAPAVVIGAPAAHAATSCTQTTATYWASAEANPRFCPTPPTPLCFPFADGQPNLERTGTGTVQVPQFDPALGELQGAIVQVWWSIGTGKIAMRTTGGDTSMPRFGIGQKVTFDGLPGVVDPVTWVDKEYWSEGDPTPIAGGTTLTVQADPVRIYPTTPDYSATLVPSMATAYVGTGTVDATLSNTNKLWNGLGNWQVFTEAQLIASTVRVSATYLYVPITC